MKKFKVFTQSICSDCLQLLVNGESEHSEQELKTFNDTLSKWAESKYIPAGMSDNDESFFSYSKCDLCNQMAGDRHEYNFFQK